MAVVQVPTIEEKRICPLRSPEKHSAGPGALRGVFVYHCMKTHTMCQESRIKSGQRCDGDYDACRAYLDNLNK